MPYISWWIEKFLTSRTSRWITCTICQQHRCVTLLLQTIIFCWSRPSSQPTRKHFRKGGTARSKQPMLLSSLSSLYFHHTPFITSGQNKLETSYYCHNSNLELLLLWSTRWSSMSKTLLVEYHKKTSLQTDKHALHYPEQILSCTLLQPTFVMGRCYSCFLPLTD